MEYLILLTHDDLQYVTPPVKKKEVRRSFQGEWPYTRSIKEGFSLEVQGTEGGSSAMKLG